MDNKERVKLQRKLTQGVKVICKTENKAYEQLFSKDPTESIFCIHYGNGDESDYNEVLKSIENPNEIKLHLFPGICYGLIEFETIGASQVFFSTSKNLTRNDIGNYYEYELNEKKKYIFFLYSKLNFENLCKRNAFNFKDSILDINIPGAKFIRDFISQEESKKIINFLDSQEWVRIKQRRVQHFGYKYLYELNNVDVNQKTEIPSVFSDLLLQLKNVVDFEFTQITVNDYFPGDGIPPHHDQHQTFGEHLIIISLLSGLTMTFDNPDTKEVQAIYLEENSLLHLAEESRYLWNHGIAQRKLDKVQGKIVFRKRRVSLTIRSIKNSVCSCQWPNHCESQNYFKLFNAYPKEKEEKIEYEETKLDMNQNNDSRPSDLEKKYFYDAYENNAPHFSHTRYKPWPKIAEFLNSLEKGSFVADIGCGNGKYLGVNPELYMFGSDRAESFMQICKEKNENYQVFSADSLKLPLRDDLFDSVISVAVIHHFSNDAMRIQAIQELTRVLKKEGKVLIYVWAMEQNKRNFQEQDIFVPWNLQYRFEDQEKLDKLKSNQNFGENNEDILLNEEKNSVVYKRYYHVFKKGELEGLIQKNIPNLKITDSYYDHENWCIVAVKI